MDLSFLFGLIIILTGCLIDDIQRHKAPTGQRNFLSMIIPSAIRIIGILIFLHSSILSDFTPLREGATVIGIYTTIRLFSLAIISILMAKPTIRK